MLLTLVVGGVFLFFFGIMPMFVIYGLVIFGLLACFGCFHYLLWGRSMSREVAAEREEEEGAGEPDERFTDGPHGPSRF
jgi:hypothetical protein